jgi:L-rhamnose mutarotase
MCDSSINIALFCAIADSIFFDNDRTLFATFKYVGTDFEGDMELMRANPKVREWWAMTDGMQVGRASYMDRQNESADMGELCFRTALYPELWAVQTARGGGKSWTKYFTQSK